MLKFDDPDVLLGFEESSVTKRNPVASDALPLVASAMATKHQRYRLDLLQ